MILINMKLGWNTRRAKNPFKFTSRASPKVNHKYFVNAKRVVWKPIALTQKIPFYGYFYKKVWSRFQNRVVERDNVPFVRLNRGSGQRMDEAQAERRGERAHQTCPRCNHCGKQITFLHSQLLIKGTTDNGSVRKERTAICCDLVKLGVTYVVVHGRPYRYMSWRGGVWLAPSRGVYRVNGLHFKGRF